MKWVSFRIKLQFALRRLFKTKPPYCEACGSKSMMSYAMRSKIDYMRCMFCGNTASFNVCDDGSYAKR